MHPWMHEWTIECKVGVLTIWVSFRFWRNLNIVLRKCIISWRRKGHETFGAGRQNTAALGPPVIGNRKGGVETLLIRPRELVRAQGLHHYVPTACLTRALLILHVELVQHWNQAIREDKSLLKVSFFLVNLHCVAWLLIQLWNGHFHFIWGCMETVSCCKIYWLLSECNLKEMKRERATQLEFGLLSWSLGLWGSYHVGSLLALHWSHQGRSSTKNGGWWAWASPCCHLLVRWPGLCP